MKKLDWQKGIYDSIGLYLIALWFTLVFIMFPMIAETFTPEDSIYFIVDSMFDMIVILGMVVPFIGWFFLDQWEAEQFALLGLIYTWLVAIFFTYRFAKK
jgi:hypothetical protein